MLAWLVLLACAPGADGLDSGNSARALRHSRGSAFVTTTTEYTSMASWLADWGSHYNSVTFADLPVGTYVTSEYTSAGMSFTEGDDPTVTDNSGTDGYFLGGTSTITILLSDPAHAVGVEYPGALQISLYDSSGTLLYAGSNMGRSGSGHFGGIQSPASFDTIVLDDWRDSRVYIDNLHIGFDYQLDADLDGVTVLDDCDDNDASLGLPTSWFPDEDGDNFGDSAGQGLESCLQPSAYAALATDCDDDDPNVHPNAIELCDGLDNDCDGLSDDPSAADATTWYADADQDGYGDPNDATRACEAPPGYVADDTDCAVYDPLVHPGATDIPYDGIDQDCQGGDACDVDRDGFLAPPCGGEDCDDLDPATFPGADDTWYDGVDQDCAGDDDFDADADSFTRDEDCDDLDPTRAADCAADSGLPAPKSCGCASAPPRPGLLIFALALLLRRRS